MNTMDTIFIIAALAFAATLIVTLAGLAKHLNKKAAEGKAPFPQKLKTSIIITAIAFAVVIALWFILPRLFAIRN